MIVKFLPRPLTAEEENTVVIYSLTHEANDGLEYNPETKMIQDGMGALGYATEEVWVGITEIGVVTTFGTLEEMLESWNS